MNLSGADDAPTLAAPDAGSVAEVSQSSSTTDSGLTGTLVGADVDVEPLTYGIQDGTDNGDGTVSKLGTYGTLTVTTATGAYSYEKNAFRDRRLGRQRDAERQLHGDGERRRRPAGDADLHGEPLRRGRRTGSCR